MKEEDTSAQASYTLRMLRSPWDAFCNCGSRLANTVTHLAFSLKWVATFDNNWPSVGYTIPMLQSRMPGTIPLFTVLLEMYFGSHLLVPITLRIQGMISLLRPNGLGGNLGLLLIAGGNGRQL